MPIILLHRQERLSLTSPEQPSDIQLGWEAIRPRLRAAAATAQSNDQLDGVLRDLDRLIGRVQALPATTIYYHRLTYQEREEVLSACSQRGLINQNTWDVEVSKRAVDGWDALYGADLQEIKVPLGPTEDQQRQRIAEIVEFFPAGDLRRIATAAYEDSPEELKKNWLHLYGGSSSSPLAAPEKSLTVQAVVSS